jgi:hypothetical protein
MYLALTFKLLQTVDFRIFCMQYILKSSILILLFKVHFLQGNLHY